MNKKLLICLLLVASGAANAEDSPFPSTRRGIQIVPLAKQGLPASLKQEILNKLEEEKVKGYQVRNDENARYLLNIRRTAPQQIKEAKNNKDVYDTHLKSSYSEIKLSFPFKSVPTIEDSNVVGYAAIGSYESEKGKKEGWTGIKEIFTTPFLGNCAYSYMAILGVQLAKETTEYFVNNKPSNKIIEGNHNSGFLYTINWYTNDHMNILECANMKFDQQIMDKMKSLANKIDKP